MTEPRWFSEVGQASRLLVHFAPQSLSRETPGQTAGTAAPHQFCLGSWSRCAIKIPEGLPMKLESDSSLTPPLSAEEKASAERE